MSLMPFSSRSSSRSSGGDNGEKKLSSRKYTISLSFSGLITGGIIMIIAIGWIFAFGVIVGRGYNPEKKMPELARLLPPPEGQPDEAKEAKGILKPEELTFMTALKQPQAAANAVPGSKPDPRQARPAAQPAAPASPQPAAAPTDKAKYDFVFQVVAYKSRDHADKLRERMDGEGLRTRMTIEKDNRGRPKWFRVQVLLRGTEADAADAKQMLAKMGLKDAKQISKKAVGRGR